MPTQLLEMPDDDRALFGDVSGLIEAARTRAALAVNSELVMLYWSIGKRIREDILGGERAKYGQAVVKRLAERLAERYGRGYSWQNLFRMMALAELYPDVEIFSTLSTILSWSHFVNLIQLPDQHKRDFYATFAAHERWSVRALRSRIDDKLYERTIEARGGVNGLEEELAALRDTGSVILCADKGPQQTKLLGLDDGEIRAARYITEPLREQLQRRLREAVDVLEEGLP